MVDAKAHKVHYLDDGSHMGSFTTLPWAAEATAQILRNPELAKNKLVAVRAFETSQREVVAALEKVQGVKYEINQADAMEYIEENQRRFDTGDMSALGALIRAGILSPGYGSNFVEGTIEVVSDKLDLPKLTLEEVVEDSIKEL
jgi:hypothetical protein